MDPERVIVRSAVLEVRIGRGRRTRGRDRKPHRAFHPARRLLYRHRHQGTEGRLPHRRRGPLQLRLQIHGHRARYQGRARRKVHRLREGSTRQDGQAVQVPGQGRPVRGGELRAHRRKLLDRADCHPQLARPTRFGIVPRQHRQGFHRSRRAARSRVRHGPSRGQVAHHGRTVRDHGPPPSRVRPGHQGGARRRGTRRHDHGGSQGHGHRHRTHARNRRREVQRGRDGAGARRLQRRGAHEGGHDAQRLCAGESPEQDSHREGAAGHGTGYEHDGRRCERRTRAQGGEYGSRHGEGGDRRREGGVRDDFGGRQLCHHRLRREAGSRRVGQPP
mmetsp:Transcript_32173/g.77793  ORF Transcript_32173/g.77793 Transcript_32173/m.77793 type:complete len:332 (+) Transcript_32173:1663-2658(+)